MILSESQDFILNEGPNKSRILDFTKNKTRATIPIRLNNDTMRDIDGTISVTLTADTADTINYTVATTPNNSTSVNVFDDDTLPVISIAAENGDVAEECWSSTIYVNCNRI